MSVLYLPACAFGSLMLSAAFAVSASAASFQLTTSDVYATGIGSYDVKTGDLNADGKPDIVAAIYDGAKVCVLLNNGAGKFPVVAEYVGGSACAIDIADYDGDGRPDVASANYNQGTVSLRLNVGGGALGAATSWPVGTQARDLVSADFDGDGERDLAVATSSSRVWLLRGHGAAGFEPATSILVGGQPKGIDARDFDGDGKVDLAVVDIANRQAIPMRNTGGMTFSIGSPILMGTGASDIVLRDFDHDTDPDLAVANEDGTVSVSINQAGNFAVRTNYAVGHMSQSVAVGDFNADGESDLLVSNYSENTVTVLAGIGNGSFGTVVTGQSAGGLRAAAAGDFDSDGALDVVTGDFNAGTLHVLRNSPLGAGPDFHLVPAGTYTTEVGAYDIKAADFNGDSRPDLMAAIYDGGKVAVLRNDGSGGFPVQTQLSGGDPVAVAAIDNNRDGRIDLLSANYTGGSLSLRINLGQDTFGGATNFPLGPQARDLAVADFDGDGFADVAVACKNRVYLLRGLSAGGFGIPSFVNVFGDLKGVAAGDLDLDGRPDIVVANPAGTAVILRNAGGMNFNLLAPLSLPGPPSDVALGDLDRDGDLDIALSCENNKALVLGNLGTSFESPRSFDISPFAQSIDIADFNLDGLPDLLVAGYTDSKVMVLAGRGGLSFVEAANAITGNGPRAAVAADFDGDGRPDIATGDFLGGTVRIFRNVAGVPQPPPPPPPPLPSACPGIRLGVPGQPAQAVVADFDGDGIADVASVSESGWMSYIRGIEGTPSGPRLDVAIAPGAQSVAAGDLDGDGRPELVVADAANHALAVFRKSGPGFVPLASLPVEGAPRFVLLADLNRDGRLDLASANDAGSGLPGKVTIHFNDPQATWTLDPEPIGPRVDPEPDPITPTGPTSPPGSGARRVDLPVGVGPCMLAAADLDGDNEVDLVVNEFAGGTLSVLFALGNGRFHDAQSFAVPGRWSGIGDLNEDGRPEIVVADFTGNALKVLWNAASNPFSTSEMHPTERGPRSVVVADLNGDGRRDLVYATDWDGVLGSRLGMSGGDLRQGPSCLAGPGGRSVALSARASGGFDAYVVSHGENVVVQRSFPSGFFAHAGDAELSAARVSTGALFGLERPTPNPATGTSAIAFGLPAAGRVRLGVYDVRGRLVRTLIDGPIEAGRHDRTWDGVDARGIRARSGIYFYRLEAPQGRRVERLVLLGGLRP